VGFLVSIENTDEVLMVPFVTPSLGVILIYTVLVSVLGKSVPIIQGIVRVIDPVSVSMLDIWPVEVVTVPLLAVTVPSVEEAQVVPLVE
jgi:hypothetical protein